ncbi:MAG TPA: hypothetical protein VMN57_08170 [Anaerolineales bacterium]|nr:hypothetical protein [Anaerolineales bacterium]
MRKSYRAALAIFALLVLAAAVSGAGDSQSEARELFPTRHSVEGAFLDFYRAIPNPELIYGYPITEAFTDETGLRVQYFQRARFELRPDGVVLTPLGSVLYHPGRPRSVLNTGSGGCRGFDSGFRVCGGFLAFFNAHGGVEQFGRPISPVEQDGVRHVQYFDYARLEWYPESRESGLEVRIGELGQLYFDFLEEDPGRLVSIQTNDIIQITQLRIHAFAATAAVRGAADQQVYIIVQDQTYAPVAGLELAITIRYPDGRLETHPAVSNAMGFVEVVIPVDPDRWGEGRVYIQAIAAVPDPEKSAQTSFWSTR